MAEVKEVSQEGHIIHGFPEYHLFKYSGVITNFTCSLNRKTRTHPCYCQSFLGPRTCHNSFKEHSLSPYTDAYCPGAKDSVINKGSTIMVLTFC